MLIIGDVTLERVKDLAEILRTYSWPDGTSTGKAQGAPHRAARRVVLKNARQTPCGFQNLSSAKHASGEKQNAHPLEVLAQVLGGGTTRLYRKLVVERGIASGEMVPRRRSGLRGVRSLRQPKSRW